MWHQALRNLVLISFLSVSGFFILVLVLDYTDYRQQIVQSSFFPEKQPLAEIVRAEAMSSELNIAEIFRAVTKEAEVRLPRDVLVRMTGDVAPVRSANIQLKRKGMGHAFAEMEDFFRKDDLSIVNLETPLIENCPETNEGMIFCGEPAFAGAMKDAGIDLVGLANNHSLNYGRSGLDETKRHLDETNLLSVDDQELVLLRIKETTFGIVAVNGVMSRKIDRDEISSLLRKAKVQSEVVIVSIHWGREYELVPQSAPGVAVDDPRELGKWLIDNGADLVLGNHPHVVQGVEKYLSGWIAYSHGNFLFDQEWSQETKEGVVGNYLFRDGVLVDLYFTPIVIDNWVQPRFADLAKSQVILGRMKAGSYL